MKKCQSFYLKIFSFLEVKFSIYLNRRVFIMPFLTTLTGALLILAQKRIISKEKKSFAYNSAFKGI